MDTIFIVLVVLGALCALFAVMAFLADVILPAVSRRPWRPQATRRK